MSMGYTSFTEHKFYIVNHFCVLTFGEQVPYKKKCHYQTKIFQILDYSQPAYDQSVCAGRINYLLTP